MEEVTTDDTCRGCGKAGGDCAHCLAIQSWYIACGCDHHGDHLGCTKECRIYGCAHPRGIVIEGSLRESELYSGGDTPDYLIARSARKERRRLERKYRKKLQRIDDLLEEFEEKC